MNESVSEFLQGLVPVIRSLETRGGLAYWNYTTTGEEKYADEYSSLLKELIKVYSDPEKFARVEALRREKIGDPLLLRQLELLYNDFASNQMTSAEAERLVKLETEVEGIFTRFRAELRGKRASDNEIRDILINSDDSALRQEAWLASKQVGTASAPVILELVRLRNQIAREQGYRDYYQMSLALNEIEETELFALLDELKHLTDDPFASIKQEMDEVLARRFGITPGDLRPWHYTDPFFQEAPPVFGADLDPYFKDKKLEDLALAHYNSLGMDASGIVKRSDLYEREGKNQHAFCMDIDRQGDIRVLANLRPNEKWMETILHELGHGVYDQYHDPELPYLLRKYAHLCTTEAIAMLMGRLTKEPAWLTVYAGIPGPEAQRLRPPLQKQEKLGMLIFVRWCLVMVYFERDIYSNPEQDLNTLWWDYVERLQFLTPPANRRSPDWASKIHLGTSPVYYQNYLLGELIASQILAALRIMGPRDRHPLVQNPTAGDFLREKIFRPGAKYAWNQLLEKATGEKLNPRHFVQQFVS